MLKKPSLEDPPGQIVDPAFIPNELRNRLLKHLIGLNLDEHQRAEFLDRCSEWCHEALGATRGASLDDQKKQLGKIASEKWLGLSEQPNPDR